MPCARGLPFERTACLQKRVPKMRNHVSHELRLIALRREQDEFREAFDHHRGQLGQVGIAALDSLLHQLIDLAVEAFGHHTFRSIYRLLARRAAYPQAVMRRLRRIS